MMVLSSWLEPSQSEWFVPARQYYCTPDLSLCLCKLQITSCDGDLQGCLQNRKSNPEYQVSISFI